MTKEEARRQLINFEGSLELPSLEAIELSIEALEPYWNTGKPTEECEYVCNIGGVNIIKDLNAIKVMIKEGLDVAWHKIEKYR